jgi:hypothetical protein
MMREKEMMRWLEYLNRYTLNRLYFNVLKRHQIIQPGAIYSTGNLGNK